MRWNKPLGLAVGLMFVTSTLVAGVANAYHQDSPQVFSETRSGDVSWGLEMQNSEESDINIEVLGDRPITSSRLTIGVVFFDENENWEVMAAHTVLLSPDRQVIRPAPETGNDVQPMFVKGDASALDNVEFDFHTRASSQGSDEPTCPAWFCVDITIKNADAREHNLITWMGGMSEVTLNAYGDGLESVNVNRGDATAVGDAELPAGTANVQAQETVCDTRTSAPSCPGSDLAASYDVKTGAKVIVDVGVPVQADQALWGFFNIIDVKLFCQFTVGVCVFDVPGMNGCRYLLAQYADEKCGRADISFDGPGDLGADHEFGAYTLQDAPPGQYEFNVDRMVDAWGPRIFEPETTSFVFAGEYFTMLTLADVSLPS